MYRRYMTLRNGPSRFAQRNQSRINRRRVPNQRVRMRFRSGRSGSGTTTQHDTTRQYRRKSMPRRKRRSWKRFKNKVHAVSEKDLGSRTVVFNTAIASVNSTVGAQSLQHIALYGGMSTTAHLDDMQNISGYENAGDPTAAEGGTVSDTTKFIFKSGVLDLTFKNSSTLRANDADGYDSSARMEVDVYEIVSSRAWNDATGIYYTLGDCFTKGGTMAKLINGTGTNVDLGLRGVTPFDLPSALSYFRMKILKKTKYFLANEATFTYQVRDPKRRVWTQEYMQRLEGPNIRGATRHLLIVSKLIPGLTLGTTNGTFKESFDIGVTRKYFYKLEGENDDRDLYVSQ